MSGEALAYHAVRGYWIVRLLEDTRPGFLRALLAERRAPAAIESQIAEKLGLQPENLWREIDDVVSRHFRKKVVAAN